MKIKQKYISYEEVMQLPRPAHKRPLRPSLFFRTVIRLGSVPSLHRSHVRYKTHRMEAAGKGPWLILMNHSCFMDLKIASKIFYPKAYNIVCTTDALVGMPWLIRWIGGIPTQKFVSDLTLIRDIIYAIKEKKTSVLMYPEAGYSFDGRATPLPRKMGVLLKKLGVPVVSVITEGAFARDPLYNGLQLRKVRVNATVSCLLTPEEIQEKSVEELDCILDEIFTFDNFRWQQENNVKVSEPFRADGLHRILYQCPHCLAEGKMEGNGTLLTCQNCSAQYELTEYGKLSSVDGNGIFDHVPDWYDWQRTQVRKQVEREDYSESMEVEIGLMLDYKALYRVGEGVLTHNKDGFTLIGCDGKLNYHQPATASYTLNSDFFWYEIGDVIGIGNRNCLYYCFPKDKSVSVTKARLATEELYKIAKSRKETKV